MTEREETVEVFVRLTNGNGCRFSLLPALTLQRLAKYLKTTSLQLPSAFRFVFSGRRIHDQSTTLSELKVSANSILHIEPISKQKTQNRKIDVAFVLKGEKIVVKLLANSTVAQLKQAISKTTTISTKYQVLVFLGKKLKDYKTLQHYRIGADSLLNLIVCQKDCPYGAAQVHPELELMSSVASLAEKRTCLSQTTLFRSDSINRRSFDDIAPYEVAILQKNDAGRKDTHPELQLDLFNSLRNPNQLKNSITFNLFDSYPEARPRQVEESDSFRGSLEPTDQQLMSLCLRECLSEKESAD